jgi:hypothetical protein
MDYTTLAALKIFGNFDTSHDDELLAALISAASRMIDNHTGRKFGAEAETSHTFTASRHWDPFDGDTLLLDEDLADEASFITGSPTVTYLPSEPPYWGIVLTEGIWADPTVVTGYWAYSRQAPPDVELACLRLAKWGHELKNTTRGDAVVVTTQGAVLLPAALPADVVAMLAPYRRVKMASPR